MKKILRSKRPIEIETPGATICYPAGTVMQTKADDRLNDDGLHICWGHGEYITIERDAFEVLAIHTKTIKVETIVGEDGEFIETRVVG